MRAIAPEGYAVGAAGFTLAEMQQVPAGLRGSRRAGAERKLV